MDIMELTKQIKLQAESGFENMYNQTEILDSGFTELHKHEQTKNGVFVWAVPMQLQFDINPINPSDPAFSAKHKFKVADSAENFVKLLKELMNKDDNKSLKAYYAKKGGMSPDEYDTSDPTIITEQDIKVFAQFRLPAVLDKYTQKITTSSAGKFGTERATPVRVDDEGHITDETKGYLGAQFILFEQAIRAQKFAKFKLEHPEETLSDDAKNDRKAIKDSMKTRLPKRSGVLFTYEFPCNAKDEKLKDITSTELLDYLTYLNFGADSIKKIAKKIGKKKDTHLNYMLLKVTYGDGKGNDTEELNLYKSREYEPVVESDDDLFVPAHFENFEEVFNEAVAQGLQGEYEKLSTQIYKFGSYTDQNLYGYFHERVEEVKDFIDQNIFNEFFSLIESTNLEFSKKLLEASKANKLAPNYIEVVNANYKEIGATAELDELDEEDAKEAAKNELTSDTDMLEDGSDLADFVSED